jgi:threonylcarbamoyladenosine tRNA methylthiotransferase MtaB
MPQLDGATIRARAADLRSAVSRIRQNWLEQQVGKPQTILAEADGCGYSESYARVAAPAGTPTGSIVTVTPTQLNQGLLA